MKLTRHILVFSMLLSSAMLAADNEDYLTYGIPAGAKKTEPRATRDPQKQECLYFAPGSEKTRENLIAIELIDHEVVVKRELLKDGKKHGIQREWHPNGRPKLEAPYRDGSMEGTFKEWNENGDLIGQYSMSKGTGVVKVYDSTGRLVREDHYKNNQRDGLRMERLTDKISLTWSKDGHRFGKGCDFYENGELAGIGFFSNNGQVNGPAVTFSREGAPTRTSWYLSGQKVSEAEYAAVALKDPSLPRYYPDVSEYKHRVGEDMREWLEKYRTMPRVKIPLQFDQKGEPILAAQDLKLPSGNSVTEGAIGRQGVTEATPEEPADPPLGKIRKLDLSSVNDARTGLAEVLASVPEGPDGQSSPWFARLKAIKTQLDQTASSQNQTELFAVVPLLAEVFRQRQQGVPAFVGEAYGGLANLSVSLLETAATHVDQQNASIAKSSLEALVTMFRIGEGFVSEANWEERPIPIDSAGVMILDASAVVDQLRTGPWEEAQMFLGGVEDVSSCFARYAPGGDGLGVLKTKYTQNRAMIDAQFVWLKNRVTQQEAAAVAYRELAEATALPGSSVDAAGKTLPQEFISYLADENNGHDRMVGGLSPKSAAAYATLMTTLGKNSVDEILWFVAGIAKNAEPSAIDFITYSSVRILVREYPSVLSQVPVQSVVASPWKTLSESPNPIFRFLAISEMERVVKNRVAAVALLNARVGESDPTILKALVEQLFHIGGADAKASLGEIEKNAHERGDDETANLAKEAIGKIQ